MRIWQPASAPHVLVGAEGSSEPGGHSAASIGFRERVDDRFGASGSIVRMGGYWMLFAAAAILRVLDDGMRRRPQSLVGVFASAADGGRESQVYWLQRVG